MKTILTCVWLNVAASWHFALFSWHVARRNRLERAANRQYRKACARRMRLYPLTDRAARLAGAWEEAA